MTTTTTIHCIPVLDILINSNFFQINRINQEIAVVQKFKLTSFNTYEVKFDIVMKYCKIKFATLPHYLIVPVNGCSTSVH